MVKIKIVYTPPGGLEQVSSLEAQGFRESPNHLHLDERCGSAIAAVVTRDQSLHGALPFVLEVNGMVYRGCRIVGRGHECKVMFLTKGAA